MAPRLPLAVALDLPRRAAYACAMRKRTANVSALLGALAGALLTLLLLAFMLTPIACGCSPRGYQGDLEGRHAQYPMPPMWSTEGHIVFNADRRVYVAASDGASLNALPHARGELGLEHAISVSSNELIGFGRFACRVGWRDREYTIETSSFDTSDSERFAEDRSYPPFYPALSPDGSLIVFRSYDDSPVPETQGDGLFLAHRGETEIRRLAPTVGADAHPIAWSPNSQRIVFFGNEWAKVVVRPDGEIDGNSIPMPTGFLYVLDINDPEAFRLSKSESLPTWSPDGARIAFVRSQQDLETLVTVRPNGTDMMNIATVPQMGTSNLSSGDARGRWISWSPDGSQILFQKSPFLLVDADGSSVKTTDAGPGAYATWSPDGSRIAALLPDSASGVKLFTVNSDGSDLRVLVRWDDRSNRLIAAQGQPAPAGFGPFEWTEVPQ